MQRFIDLHCDTLMVYAKDKGEDLYENKRSIDIVRLKKAGALAQFFAVWLLDKEEKRLLGMEEMTDEQYIRKLHKGFFQALREHSKIIGFAGNGEDLKKNRESGKISAFLALEDGRAAGGKLENIRKLYQAGFRLITLTWNAENCFGWPNSPNREIMKKGLSRFGKEAVEYMNELGMLVDVSHLSDGGFYDVLKISRKPVIASHSNARALSPHPRNLTDEMIRLISEKGGVVGLNFCPKFLNQDIECMDSTIERMCAHAVHIRNTGGSECLALGTDFDGIEGNLEIDSVDKLEVLDERLRQSGFSGRELDNMMYKNALRVIDEVMKHHELY